MHQRAIRGPVHIGGVAREKFESGDGVSVSELRVHQEQRVAAPLHDRADPCHSIARGTDFLVESTSHIIVCLLLLQPEVDYSSCEYRTVPQTDGHLDLQFNQRCPKRLLQQAGANWSPQELRHRLTRRFPSLDFLSWDNIRDGRRTGYYTTSRST